jgi:hypothetical protein
MYLVKSIRTTGGWSLPLVHHAKVVRNVLHVFLAEEGTESEVYDELIMGACFC